MKFGICTSIEKSGEAIDAGWDYIEESVQGLLQGTVSDAQWDGPKRLESSRAPVLAANMLVPGSLKITGPDADLDKLRDYMGNVLRRAGQLGLKTLVFGSGGARAIPEGFDHAQAHRQIVAFAGMCAPIAAEHGVVIVFEPLNKAECNIINSVEEAMVHVREVDHPNIQCLVDSYHLWVENEPLSNLTRAMPWIRHVHVADLQGRVAPGESGKSDYVPFFRVLKEAGYDGMISVEASQFGDIAHQGPRVLEFLRGQWDSV